MNRHKTWWSCSRRRISVKKQDLGRFLSLYVDVWMSLIWQCDSPFRDLCKPTAIHIWCPTVSVDILFQLGTFLGGRCQDLQSGHCKTLYSTKHTKQRKSSIQCSSSVSTKLKILLWCADPTCGNWDIFHHTLHIPWGDDVCQVRMSDWLTGFNDCPWHQWWAGHVARPPVRFRTGRKFESFLSSGTNLHVDCPVGWMVHKEI